MALDGITAQLLAHELDNELQGARIDKVFEPDKYTVILHIRTNSGIRKLLLSANPSAPRINITESTRENPQMPPSFCMLLRKHLSGSRIVSITNPGYERIIEITASTTDELHDTKNIRLIVELMGRYSNLILVNAGGKILDSLIHVDYSVSRVREVMPARIYEYPPTQDKFTCEEVLSLVSEGMLPIEESEMGRPMDKALLNSIKGISPNLCRQLCMRADIDDRLPAKNLTKENKDALISVVKDFALKVINCDYEPASYYSEDDMACDYSPFELIGHAKMKKAASISEAIDMYYLEKDRFIDLDNKKQRLKTIIGSALTHATRKAELHMADKDEGSKADHYKHCADLILGYQYMLKGKEDSLTCSDYYVDPPKDVTIKLDPSLNASDNAQEYYKRFRKAKRKLQLAEEYLVDDQMAIDYLRSLKAAADAASCEDDINAINMELMSISAKPTKTKHVNNQGNPNATVGKAKSGKASSRALREAAKRAREKNASKGNKNERPLPFRQYETSDGRKILCGRNNIQNDELTFKIADKDDWWFHIKGMPGTHVILKSVKGEEFPPDNSVIEAAQTAAFFSKSIMLEEHAATEGSKAGDIKAEVDYCKVSHVKKIPGAKPGMVIYEGYYSIVVSAKEIG